MNNKIKLRIVTLVMILNGLIGFAQSNIPQNKKFIIQSALNYGKDFKGCWDIPGISNIAKGKNLGVYQYDNACDQHFYLSKIDKEGYYSIYTCDNNKLNIDVANAGHSNGTNVLLWNAHYRNNQKFKFHHLGKGRYKIEAKTGGFLVLDNRSSANGSNIQIGDSHNGAWCEWVLVDPDTKQAYIPEMSSSTPVTEDEVDEVFFIVEEMPEFQGGGMEKVREYIKNNVQYPPSAKNRKIQGRVFISYVVNKEGDVSNVNVVRSLDPELDKEAVRVIKSLPKFKPGKQRGKAVDVGFTLPVVFKL